MAPRVPQGNDPGKPTQPSLWAKTENTIQKPQHDKSKRTKRISEAASRFFVDPNRARWQEENSEWTRQWEAEQERRRNLGFLDRLREDGQKLRQEIENNPAMTAFLEVSRSERARCRARDDCIYAQKNIARGETITTDFRIRVEGAMDLSFWAPAKHYYHIECFDWMVDLKELIPENMKLEERNWGLMVRKWFEHRGKIDLAKIDTYIEEHKAFEEEYERANPNRMPRDMQWWLSGHSDCAKGEAGCSHPLPPHLAGTPILKDYVLENGSGCYLSNVLRHELMDELPVSFRTVGWCVARFVPEVEVRDDAHVEGAGNAEPMGENREHVGAEEKGKEERVPGG